MKQWTVRLSGLIGLIGVTFIAAFTVGGVSLMTTFGISMEPGFPAGDLAVLYPSPDYGVGDVVAYHSEDLNTAVMHRITAVDGDRYTFQGDNNTWLDPEQPTRDQLLGKLALRVPGGGVWLKRATSRPTIIAFIFLLVASGGTRAAVRRRGKKQRDAIQPRPARTTPAALLSAAAAVAAATIAAASLATVAWNTPLNVSEAAAVVTPATMTFSYVARVPASRAYDETTVTQPQPIFRNVIDRVDVHVTYESVPVPADTTLAVYAELATANGWRSTIPLAQPVSVTSNRHTGVVELDIELLQARANAAAEAISGEPPGDVTVAVVADVQTAEEAVFRSELPFVLDRLSLRLAEAQDTPMTVTDATAPPPTTDDRAPLSVLGHAFPVLQVRRASLAAVAGSLLAAAVLLLLVRRARSAPENVSIQRRYAPLLLDVEPIALPAGRPLIEVPLIQGLARLAERYGLMVMHWHRGGVHTYVVLEEHTTYRFRTADTLPVEGPQQDAQDEREPWLVDSAGPT